LAKPFDSTTKQLVEAHPHDWLAYAGLPPAATVRVVDADLSSYTVAADKVLRVDAHSPYIAHFEFQSGVDPALDTRILVYNVLLRARHKLPVRSVAVILRPEAQSPNNVGQVRDIDEPSSRLDFTYRLIRVWEEPYERLLAGGMGTLPLAPVSAVRPEEVESVVRRMEQRLDAEAPAGKGPELQTAAYVLMGLRYPRSLINQLLQGVRNMKESVTYQAILEEGMQQGEQDMLIFQGTKKFGPPDGRVLSEIRSISDVNRLMALAGKLLDAASWDELLPAN
jgi:predicted transposase YdaD